MSDSISSAVRRPVDTIDALGAFARLYGYVRFFHPSDEAAAVDWERLAVLGARRVQEVQDRDALRRVLESLFLPIAPTVQVWSEEEAAPRPLVASRVDTDDLVTVAWQHVGCGLQQRGDTYRSLRVGRGASFLVEREGDGLPRLVQRIPAGGLRGQRLRLRVRVRTEIAGNDARILLFLRERLTLGGELDYPGLSAKVDLPDETVLERELEVSEQAAEVIFGCVPMGRSGVWLADFEVAVEEGGVWRTLEIDNASFAAGLAGWEHELGGYDHSVEDGALHLERRVEYVDRLFEACPQVGETTEKPIGAGLLARVPLALYGTAVRTLGEPRMAIEPLLEALSAIDDTMLADPLRLEIRTAAITIGWNVLQHFYPYFDVVDADWVGTLRRTLERTRDDEDARAFLWTLIHMLAPLEDGHAGVVASGELWMDHVPVSFAWAGERVAVQLSESPDVLPGDVLVAVDGRPIADLVAETGAWVSGSPQWRRLVAVWMLARGKSGEEAVFTLDRFGETVDVRLRYERKTCVVDPLKRTVERLEDGVYVVDLSRTSWDVLETRLEELAAARGVVFDMREYPKGNSQILCHLLAGPHAPDTRFQLSHRTRPDGDGDMAWKGSGWDLEPKEPHLGGPVAFLTGPGAISFAESVMSYVEQYRFGEIVGEVTAGTNGNMHIFSVSGGVKIGWTGMRVVKHDGAQQHGIGILPTVRIVRTPEGLRDGRDEALEAALEIVRRSSASTPGAV